MEKINKSTIAVFVLLVLAVFSVNVYAISGSGTENDPWLIESLPDFNDFVADANYWADYTRLDVDLDLAGITYTTSPISPDTSSTTGFQGTEFTGSFNGNSRTISGLIIDATSTGGRYHGLFGYIGSTGEIKNLTVADCDIAGRVDSDFIGALTGFNFGTIKRCCATGSVSGRDTIGGLIGYNSSNGNVSNCYAQVSVTGDDKLGGLIGGCYDSTVSYCYSTGTVSGDDDVGGLIGYNNGGIITACFWDVQTSLIFSSAGGTGKTTSEMQEESTFTDEGWDFVGETDNGTEFIWMIESGNVDYPRYSLGGSGSEVDPFVIRSREDFDMFTSEDSYWADGIYIRLETDINLADITYTTAVIAPDTDNATLDYQGTVFAGSLDGKGHVISNLTIDAGAVENDYLGLFGQLDHNSVIKNLSIQEYDIASETRPYYIGGLTGMNYGIISNCDATGQISLNGGVSIGGLAGRSEGYVSNCHTSVNITTQNDACGSIGGLIGTNVNVGGSAVIYKCYASGSITGGNNSGSLGGLVGTNFYSGEINNCYATTSVTSGLYSDEIGGLTGTNYSGYINNSYATGNVTGNSEVGGLCGRHTVTSEIHTSYSTGLVTGNADVGGLIGIKVGSTSITANCFWDIETSGQANSAGGEGKTTAEMKQRTTFDDWDFAESWGIEDNQIYPFIRLTYPTGDIDLDKDVDFTDFAHFANHWLEGVEWFLL
ncbi:MAG: hypothetical protein KAS96_04110 [Planctomycetes bacterium]|nr:hypothetical protein [Planctomycetota bacterium]